MKKVYSILFACQLVMQAYLVHMHSSSSTLSIAALALSLAAVQAVVALLVIVSAQVNPPYKMPASGVEKRLSMLGNSLIFAAVGSFMVLIAAAAIPGALVTTQFWQLLASSVVAGSAANALFAQRLSDAHGA
ncbi:MAG: hypothetical protein K2Y22_06230 [Candidatus Obscuribacterales bacterium]|nr:hypothetical protein [Candidatus Obscuribacterales bacterium]